MQTNLPIRSNPTPKASLTARLCSAGLRACLTAILFLLITSPLQATDKQVVHGAMAPVVATRIPSGPLSGETLLHLAIGLPLRDQAGLTQLIQELYDPANPKFRKFLTPMELAAKYGPTEQDYQAVMDWAKANGLTVTAQSPNRLVLDVQGTVTDIQKALSVNLQVFTHPTESRTFFAPDREPTLDLATKVLTIDGLNNYDIPHPNSIAKPIPQGGEITPNDDGSTPSAGSAPGGNYAACDFRAAYLPGTTLRGNGQSVGLLQYDSYFASDISAYTTQFGIAPVPLVNVVVNGPMPAPGGGNIEVCLDIEMILSMAPGVSTIYVYEAPNTLANWVPLLNRMHTDSLANQFGCSWSGGGPNASGENVFQLMAASGQSFYNATGDNDAFTGAIPFPSESPNITEVGGTTLTTAGPCGAYTSETAWNRNNGIGSAGGISPTFGIPFWQTGISMAANLGSTARRNIPDVALTAESVYVRAGNGLAYTTGGTSCAAPLWAGFTALINQQAAVHLRPPVGFLNPAIYALGKTPGYIANFHDTTVGNNFSAASPTHFPAVTGYDLCTGWGTPSGQALINYLAGVPPMLPNGGFETGDFTSWQLFGNTGGSYVSTGSYAHSGTYGAGFNQVGSLGYLYQELATVPGQVYVVSFWLQNFSASGPSEFIAYWNGTVLMDQVNPTVLGWQQFQFTVTATTTSSYVEFGAHQDPSAFALDDVTVTPLPGNQGISPGVPNGGFEAGNYSSWSQSGNPGSTFISSYAPTWVHSGIYGSQMGPVGSLGYLTQVLPTVPGETYLLSFWLDNFGTTNNEFSVSWNTNVIYDLVNAGSFGWGDFQFYVTATGPSTELKFGFRNDPSYWGLDDVTLTPLASRLLGEAAYVRSAVGEPWGQNNNRTALDRVFGPGNWNDSRFETVDPDVLFSPAVHFVFLEGSDQGANALNTFLAANRSKMQSWVSNGGSLFVNAAPNQGGNINLGFGVTLNYAPNFSPSGTAVNALNPIFRGPYVPVGTYWTGNSFSHATITGAGVTPLIINTNNGSTILGEMTAGLGHVLFGGMTVDFYHSPQPQGANLRANILQYGNSAPQGTFDDLPAPAGGLPVPAGYRGVTWNNFNYLDAITYVGNPSGYLAGLVSPSNDAYNSGGGPASITSATPFNFISAQVTAAWNDNLVLEAKGYVSGVLTYDQTYVLSATAPTLISFNFLGVTEVDFITSGGTPHAGYGGLGTHFAMDNVTLVSSPAASPGVDHFLWSVGPTPPCTNAGYAVTVIAKDINNATVTAFAGQVALSGSSGVNLIDGFESGVWPHGPWVNQELVNGVISSANTHDGNYGLGNPGWFYRTDVSLGIAGDTLSFWVRPSDSGGRAYLGFGASSAGCWSVVAAPNTGEFLIQQNTAFGYLDKATVPQTYLVGKWYKITVTFTSATAVTCNLYDEDGNTLINTVGYSGVTGLPRGVAIRSFGFSLDSVQSGTALPVPISPTISGQFVAGVWSGNIVVPQQVPSMIFTATDGFGEPTGDSNPFEVDYNPDITTIARSNNAVVLTWSTCPGGIYQVQYRTNLIQPNWINLGGTLTAVGATLSRADFTSPNPARFYRVIRP